MASPTDYSLRIALFSHPRTNSNIFTKLFESQPDVVQRTYSFTPAYMWGPERRVGYKTEKIEQLYAAFKSSYESFSTQKCLDDLELLFGEVEANVSFFLHGWHFHCDCPNISHRAGRAKSL